LSPSRPISDAFKDEMSKIAVQDEARRLLEIRNAQRQERSAKIRKVIFFLLGLAALAAAYSYRNDLEKVVESKLDRTPKINAATSDALKGIQSNAQKRDKALDELTK